MAITSVGDINGEVARRCSALGLKFDCGPDGQFTSKIAIIAEAPGERERQLKTPLIGSSGKLLWDLFKGLGLTRRNCYISNIVKRQLRQADDEKDEISRQEVEQYTSILLWELQQLPNVEYIILLGNYALEAVTGYTGISHHRGSVYDVQLQSISQGTVRKCKVIPLYNPAALIRAPSLEIITRFDIGRIKNVIQGTFEPHEINPIINPSYREANDYIRQMHDEQLPVALDIEIISNETACIGFANNSHSGMCINFRDEKTNRYSVQEEAALRLNIQRFVTDPQTKLVMQNGMFDSYWLWCKDRLRLKPSYFDTMLAHHTLYPTLPHNLGFLTSQYTTHPFYKDDGKFWKEGGNINDFWQYNVKDCCITWACHEAMMKELRDQKLEDFFFSHVMRLQPHLIRMVVGGVKVDADLKAQITYEITNDVDRLRADFVDQCRALTNDPDFKINPSSPKQLKQLFFSNLRLAGRGVATDIKNRTRMINSPKTSEEAKQMLRTLNKFATENKFKGTYAEMVIDEDQRARSEYKQTGVQSAPGRLSSAQVMWGSGANLQNQPGRAQKMYIADPGYVFSYFDLSQAEAQVVGYRAVIEKWMEDYALARTTGYDTHRALASDMFNLSYDEVPIKDWMDDEVTPTIRYKAKRCRHGLNYTMGPGELSEQISSSMDEATRLHHIYHRTNPELERWWSWTYEQVRAKRTLFNAYGRRWISLQRVSPDILGNIVAFYPQSTIGDKVSRCIYLCEDDDQWPSDARMLLNIHDALIAIHRPEDGELVRSIMQKHAEEPLYIEGVDGKTRELIIPCELATTEPDEKGIHRWSSLVKIKKPKPMELLSTVIS